MIPRTLETTKQQIPDVAFNALLDYNVLNLTQNNTNMHLNIQPGYVYIFHSKSRPGDVKIGKAESVEAREFTLSLGDPDLKLYARAFFLDVFAAEAHMHAVFASQRIDREHFRVGRVTAKKELDRLFNSCRAQRDQFERACRYMADAGELKLDRSQDVPECDGSALATLLAHVPNSRDGRNVKALIPLALAGGVQGEKASKLLATCGLLAYPVEGVVLLDKAPVSNLERVFKDKACVKTWRSQVAKYAGFNANARSVNLQVWLDATEAGSELVDRVSPLVN